MHPDKNPGADATEAFDALKQAHRLLKDPGELVRVARIGAALCATCLHAGCMLLRPHDGIFSPVLCFLEDHSLERAFDPMKDFVGGCTRSKHRIATGLRAACCGLSQHPRSVVAACP